MMDHTDFSGHTLDEKYKVESELGRGGMGTVYLATHLGTERPVAVKIISPQFMKRPEFVERFRREARAAGRLRHPNVVDVTDFGFSDTDHGTVAFLVMEYLDGCTLGEILEEENNLPVSWTLDILEQVCSAVQEAHEQGIIHRDLKPDNIWLEPNQRGGYTVKVLDFGIAKLEESMGEVGYQPDTPIEPRPFSSARVTHPGTAGDDTVTEPGHPTVFSEASTVALAAEPKLAPAVGSEDKTAILSDVDTIDGRNSAVVGTRLISGEFLLDGEAHNSALAGPLTTDLTRVGSVLGTPLYMSPEQCRGARLDARSDIYSLGVIAFQMLSGKTPFSGDFTEVMEAHRELSPPTLEAKNVRKKLKRVISSALAKDPDCRPQTAEAFASELRSRSEGIYMLLRRAAMIYTEHMPKFIILSAFFSLPMVVLTILLIVLGFLKVSESISSPMANFLMGLSAVTLSIVSAFCAYLIIGTITWIVTQFLSVPLRPIKLRAALKEARKKWKTFAGTGIVSTIAAIAVSTVAAGVVTAALIGVWMLARPGSVEMSVGLIASAGLGITIGFVLFVILSVLWMLVGPVVMMENLRGLKALRRSRELVRRSFLTAVAAFLIMFMIPAATAGAISFVVNVTAKAIGVTEDKTKADDPTEEGRADDPTVQAEPRHDKPEFSINLGGTRSIKFNNNGESDMRNRIKNAVLESLLQIILLPIQIVVTSFTAIIVALLYLKTRQAGGEPMQDLLTKFEESEHPRRKWQERVRQRLIQSGRVTSRS